jgi:hypothetical protein
MFSLNFDMWIWCLLGAGFLCSIITWACIISPLWRVKKYIVSTVDDEDTVGQPHDFGKATIIAFFHSPDMVEPYLEQMQQQQYPNFEVFVVIKGTARQADALRDTYKEKYPNTRFSFIPPESHNLSLKKLAYTLGIKSTEDSEVIITSLPECQYTSPQWLSIIMRHFANPETGVVLGYADFDYSKEHKWRRGYRHFSSLISNMEWVSEAIAGRPYRGNRGNLAFRRKLFFDNNGYGKSYFLHSGDDDIFISEIATEANTVMEVSPHAQAIFDCGDATSRLWVDHKESYGFTSHYLPHTPRRRMRIGHIANWATVLLYIATALLALPSLIPAIAALLLLLGTWFSHGYAYNSIAPNFGDKKRWSTAPLQLLYRPIADTLFHIKYRKRGVKNFTWQRK